MAMNNGLNFFLFFFTNTPKIKLLEKNNNLAERTQQGRKCISCEVAKEKNFFLPPVAKREEEEKERKTLSP